MFPLVAIAGIVDSNTIAACTIVGIGGCMTAE